MKNNKKNICRPINFYNNFLPPNSENHGWEYCAFGTFDGIGVEAAWYEEESATILKKIWNYQNCVAHSLRGKYSVQTVYAVCSADQDEEVDFWNNYQFPYTFFCRMQYGGDLSQLRRNKNMLEQCLSQPGKFSAWVYLTYDNSDLLIVIKAVSYAYGAGVINAMHSGLDFSFEDKSSCQLKNSFTVFALRQEFVDSVKDKEVRCRLNEVTIDRIIIKLIEKRCGCIKYLEDIIVSNNGRTEHILGTDDEIIFFDNLGWGDFLYLYCSKEGAFHSTSEIYKEYIGGATTTICTKVAECKCFEAYREKKMAAGLTWEKWFKRQIDVLMEKLDDKADQKYYKELYIILNALPKFSGAIVSDYVFFLVLRPLGTLIDLLGNSKVEDMAYYEFIKSFNMYVQSSVKSDKHTMQIMDFNTKIYDIPVKINALYIVFMYKVCDVLNIGSEGEKHRYDFLVVPGAANIVNVLELYSKVSDQKRLLRVEIPENRFYDMCSIMRIFSHEVAHYVGGDLRNRANRYDYMIHSIAVVYVNYIRSFWNEIDTDGIILAGEDEWRLITDRMCYKIKVKLEREFDINYVGKRQIGPENKNQIKGIVAYNEKNREYMAFLNNNLYRAISEIGILDFKGIFQSVLYHLQQEERDSILRHLGEVSQCFLVHFPEGSTKTTLNTVYECLIRVYEESFADLVSIRLLGLSAKDYLNTIIVDAKAQNMEIARLCSSEAIYRVVLMLDIFAGEKSDIWGNGIYDEDGLLEERKQLINAAYRIKMIINNDNGGEKGKQYRKNCFMALVDREVCSDIEAYLDECVRLVKEKIEKEQSEKHKEVLEVYRKLSDRHIHVEEHIVVLENFIDSYRRACMKNM